MMQIVPFTSDYDQSFRVQLGGDYYVIAARWNERGQSWNFDLTRDSDQVLLVAGVPMLSGQDCLAPYALGIGGFVLADLGNTNTDPGPDDLGDRVAVAYFTPSELAILAGAGIPGISASGVPSPATSESSGTPAPSSGGGGDSGVTTIVSTQVTQQITNLTMVGGGFAYSETKSDPSGLEVLAWQFPINAGRNSNPSLTGVLTALCGGQGTVRLYVGSSPGTLGDAGPPEGTLVGSVAVTATAVKEIVGTPLANPGGFLLAKITLQASPSQFVSVGPFMGALG